MMDPSRRGVVNGGGAGATGHNSSSGSGSSSSKQGSKNNNHNSNAATKKSSRMKEVVNYDDKRHLVPDSLEEDIAHPVAHRQLNELEEHVNDLHESCWETESIFEEILEDITEDKFFTDGKRFSRHISHTVNDDGIYGFYSFRKPFDGCAGCKRVIGRFFHLRRADGEDGCGVGGI